LRDPECSCGGFTLKALKPSIRLGQGLPGTFSTQVDEAAACRSAAIGRHEGSTDVAALAAGALQTMVLDYRSVIRPIVTIIK